MMNIFIRQITFYIYYIKNINYFMYLKSKKLLLDNNEYKYNSTNISQNK